MDKENVVYTYHGLLHHLKKEENSAIYNSMDGHAVHYAKWNKPDTKGQMLYNSTYMEFLEYKREVPALRKKQIWEASKKGNGSYCLMGTEIPLGWYKIVEIDRCS